MQVELITKEDLKKFREDLLSEIGKLIAGAQPQQKQWLKSNEVRKLLNISPGTLQNLRINGALRFTKIGGIMYYRLEDIQRLLERGSE